MDGNADKLRISMDNMAQDDVKISDCRLFKKAGTSIILISTCTIYCRYRQELLYLCIRYHDFLPIAYGIHFNHRVRSQVQRARKNCTQLVRNRAHSRCASWFAQHERTLTGASPQTALIVGRLQPKASVSIVRWNLKEAGGKSLA